VAVDAHDKAVAGEVVDFAEFEEGHEAGWRVSDVEKRSDVGMRVKDLPSLQISHDDRLVEKHEHGLLVLVFFVRHEAAEPYATDIIPHFDPVAHDAIVRDQNVRLRTVHEAIRISVYFVMTVVVAILVVFTMRTQNQRVHALLPLTQENRP
jgi:hypothetical protein